MWSMMSSRPTSEEITRALHLINEDVLIDFPFVADADRAHAIGLWLLPDARDLIDRPTPNHLIESPMPGSGKGLLADVLLGPAVGHGMGVTPPASSEEEWRKRLTTFFWEGHAVVLVDNVTQPLDSGAFASALTASTWVDRILGRSESLQVPVRCVWVTTANNPMLSREITRRSIRIRLDPEVDEPWLRENFTHPHLLQWVNDHRAALVWAALTLIQAWLTAGRPEPTVNPLGSYERWCLVIGGILQYMGVSGFLNNRSEFSRMADFEGMAWRQAQAGDEDAIEAATPVLNGSAVPVER